MWRWIKSTIFTSDRNFFSGLFGSIRNFVAGDQQGAEREPLIQEKIVLTNFLGNLPGELLLMINDHLPSVKDKAHSASVNRHFHVFFQPEIEKQAAKEAAEYAIYPTKENVEKLKTLLKDCPALLLYPVTVKNRHGKVIKGTVYQIAIHEADDELIDDVIRPAFNKLPKGLERMEEQRKTWLPDGWMEAEERVCAGACAAMDKVFDAFKSAHRNDVTELQQHPFTITINNEEVNQALKAVREAIDSLYQATDKAIESGRDPIIRLIERVLGRYEENYVVLGGYNTPRNNALLRAVFGYCQRFAPINFMQAFAQGPPYIVEKKEKLTRSFEYRHWRGDFILPLDSDPLFRLGYECFGWGNRVGVLGGGRWGLVAATRYKTFCQSKTAAALQPSVMQSWKSDCTIM